MTVENAKPAQARKTPEQALAALQAKQRALAVKAAKLAKSIEDRKHAASQANHARIGKLAADAGILDLPDEVLKVAFAEIATRNSSAESQEG